MGRGDARASAVAVVLAGALSALHRARPRAATVGRPPATGRAGTGCVGACEKIKQVVS